MCSPHLSLVLDYGGYAAHRGESEPEQDKGAGDLEMPRNENSLNLSLAGKFQKNN
jgi:hypothetical protein